MRTSDIFKGRLVMIYTIRLSSNKSGVTEGTCLAVKGLPLHV